MCPLETKYVLETFTFSLFDGHHLYFRAKSDHQCLLMESTSRHHSISPGELEGWSWISSIGITWELVSNHDSQVPPQTYWLSICILIGLPLVKKHCSYWTEGTWKQFRSPKIKLQTPWLNRCFKSEQDTMFLPWFPQLLIGGNITHFIYTYTYQGGLFWGTPPKMLDVKAFCKL